MAETRTRQSLHKQYKKKKKKKTDWKGKPYPYMQDGETTKEHKDKVDAWEKAKPDKEIPDFEVFKLGGMGSTLSGAGAGLATSAWEDSLEKKYAHGGGVRKTKLSDY